MAINMERNATKNYWFIRPFVFVVGTVQNVYSSFSSGVRGTTSLYLNLVDIKTNNRKLQNENSELRAQLGALEELRLENERLNQLLGFKSQTKMELLTAKIIAKDLLLEHSTLTLNKGTQHGIKEFMAVITVAGVVGYIIQPQLYTSQILLITDRYASVDAIVQRSRSRGILEGWNKKLCHLNYLEREDDVIIGDRIVTSGLNPIFPKGLLIGFVTEVNKGKYDTSQQVTVKPAINPFALEEVFVVLNTNNEDFLTLQESSQLSEPTEPKSQPNSQSTQL